MVGRVRSTTTLRSHEVTVTTPSTAFGTAPSGHRFTSNAIKHVPDPDRHVVVVVSARFQLTVAPSTNPAPSAGTVRVTVTVPLVTSGVGLVLSERATATPEDASSDDAPATVADATASGVLALSVSVNVCVGPATPSSSGLSVVVSH